MEIDANPTGEYVTIIVRDYGDGMQPRRVHARSAPSVSGCP